MAPKKKTELEKFVRFADTGHTAEQTFFSILHFLSYIWFSNTFVYCAADSRNKVFDKFADKTGNLFVQWENKIGLSVNCCIVSFAVCVCAARIVLDKLEKSRR